MDSFYAELRLYAEMFEDLQALRIAQASKVRSGTVDPAIMTIHYYEKAEREMAKAMILALRRVAPAGVLAWQQDSRGIGEHLLARLLGQTGHPCTATPHHWHPGHPGGRTLVAGEPYRRTVGQLWAYCGHGDPARRRRKGMTASQAQALGNPTAKTIVYLLAVSCVKHPPGPYREVYDAARGLYASRAHVAPCVRCGPSGKPAAPGSLWSRAHQHAAALRKTGKHILRDLWLAARDSTRELPRPATCPVLIPSKAEVEGLW